MIRNSNLPVIVVLISSLGLILATSARSLADNPKAKPAAPHPAESAAQAELTREWGATFVLGIDGRAVKALLTGDDHHAFAPRLAGHQLAQARKLFNQLTQVSETHVSVMASTDAELAALAGIKTLTNLEIWFSPTFEFKGMSLADHGSRVIDDAATLRRLCLRGLSATDGVCRAIGRQTSLEEIDATYSDIKLTHLGGLKNLRKLTTSHCRDITDDQLAALAKCGRLEEMSLTDGALSGVSPGHLVTLDRLKLLDLTDNPVTDDGLASIGRLSQLEMLRIGGSKITLAGIKHLSDLKNLKTIKISESNVTDDVLAEFIKLPKLERFEFVRTPISDRAVRAAKKQRPNLVATNGLPDAVDPQVMLKLWRFPARVEYSASGIETLGISGVQWMHIDGDGGGKWKAKPILTTADLAILERLDKLTYLDISDVAFDDRVARAIAGMPRLESMSLTRVKLTDDMLKTLSALPRLKYLTIYNNSSVTNAGLAHLHKAKALQAVHLRGTETTDGGEAALRAALPRCKVVHER